MTIDKNKFTKLKLFIDLDKELAYINEMNKRGWKLVYIKGGCLYTFVKTQPDEYFTIQYSESTENISQITTFAAQCGYENIPHTMDGFGDLLYLTGKKDEVSQKFVTDINAQIESHKRIHKKMFSITVINVITSIILLFAILLDLFVGYLAGFPPVSIYSTVFCLIIFLCSLPMDIRIGLIAKNTKKKIVCLESDSLIYESN